MAVGFRRCEKYTWSVRCMWRWQNASHLEIVNRRGAGLCRRNAAARMVRCGGRTSLWGALQACLYRRLRLYMALCIATSAINNFAEAPSILPHSILPCRCGRPTARRYRRRCLNWQNGLYIFWRASSSIFAVSVSTDTTKDGSRLGFQPQCTGSGCSLRTPFVMNLPAAAC